MTNRVQHWTLLHYVYQSINVQFFILSSINCSINL